jgi:hypothetical protein
MQSFLGLLAILMTPKWNPTMWPLARLALIFEVQRQPEEPYKLGAMWRGALGNLLREKLPSVETNERAAVSSANVLWHALYETRAPASSALGADQQAPGSLWLYAFPPEPKTLVVEYCILPAALDLVCALIHAAHECASRGLGVGAQRTRARPIRVIWERQAGQANTRVELDPFSPKPPAPITPEIPPAPSVVRLRTLTPMRLTHEGRPLIFNAAGVANEITTRLLRRAWMLGDSFQLPVPDQNLRLTAKTLIDQSNFLRPIDLSRVSSRQRARVPMGGYHGHLEFALAQNQCGLWPWLWLGQFLQVGQGSSFGFGRYLLE